MKRQAFSKFVYAFVVLNVETVEVSKVVDLCVWVCVYVRVRLLACERKEKRQ